LGGNESNNIAALAVVNESTQSTQPSTTTTTTTTTKVVETQSSAAIVATETQEVVAAPVATTTADQKEQKQVVAAGSAGSALYQAMASSPKTDWRRVNGPQFSQAAIVATGASTTPSSAHDTVLSLTDWSKLLTSELNVPAQTAERVVGAVAAEFDGDVSSTADGSAPEARTSLSLAELAVSLPSSLSNVDLKRNPAAVSGKPLTYFQHFGKAEAETLMVSGATFVRHLESDESEGLPYTTERIFLFYEALPDKNSGIFYWCEPGLRQHSVARRLQFVKLRDIFLGKRHDAVKGKASVADSRCVSVVSSRVSLHLEAPDEDTRNAWFFAIVAVLKSWKQAMSMGV
jgi:hypothetical protein